MKVLIKKTFSPQAGAFRGASVWLSHHGDVEEDVLFWHVWWFDVNHATPVSLDIACELLQQLRARYGCGDTYELVPLDAAEVGRLSRKPAKRAVSRAS